MFSGFYPADHDQDETNDMTTEVAKCKRTSESFAEHISKLLNEVQGTTENTLSEEALCSARNVIHYSNLLSGEVSELLRNHSPAEFSPEMDLVLHDPNYKMAVAPDAFFLRVPLAPYSIQRNAQRRNAAGEDSPLFTDYYSRRRYAEVQALVSHVDLPLYGKKLLYIAHVFQDPSLRLCPDFDNFDVKDLIDVVMDHFGGDNPCNLVVCHDAIFSVEMPSATYLAVVELESSSTLGEMLDRCERAFGEMDN